MLTFLRKKDYLFIKTKSTFLTTPRIKHMLGHLNDTHVGARRLSACTIMLCLCLFVPLLASGASIDAATSSGTVLPQRPDVLVLCGSYCQAVTLYSTAPTDARELDVYRLSRAMESAVTARGGRLLYLANLDLTSSISAALTLVRARLRADTSAIGTVLCMSDLKILLSVPPLLENISTELGFATSTTSYSATDGTSTTVIAALTAAQKYWLIVIDSLVSRGGDRNSLYELEASSSRTSSTSAGDMLVQDARPGVVTMFFVGGYLDAVGYASGAAVVSLCREAVALRLNRTSSTQEVCRVGLALRDNSRVSQLLRAGWNTAIGRLPPMFASDLVILPTAVPVTGDEIVRGFVPQRLQHRVWNANASSAALFPTASTDAPLDVFVTDGPSWGYMVQQEELANSTSSPFRGVYRNVTDSTTGSTWLGLPAVVTLLSNASTAAATMSSAFATSKRLPMVDVSVNATQIFAQLVTVLFGSSTSGGGGAAAQTLAWRLANSGACANANASDVLAAPAASSSNVWGVECSVWHLWLGAGDTHYATTTSLSSTTGTGIATLTAIVTNTTKFTDSRMAAVAHGIEYTQYHALYRRWRTAASWGVNVTTAAIAANPIHASAMLSLPVTSSSVRWPMDATTTLVSLVARAYSPSGGVINATTSTSALRTSITTIFPFGLQDTIERYFLNPHLLTSPQLIGVTYIMAQDDDAVADASSDGGTDYTDGFYTRPLAVYRYDFTSNSIDRVVVGATAAAIAVASANKSSTSGVFEFIPFQCMQMNNYARRVYMFGGETSVGAMPVQTLLSASVTGGLSIVFTVESVVSTMTPPGRLYASLTSSVGGTLYMYGGLCYSGVPCNDLWGYNVTSHTWTLMFELGNPMALQPLVANASSPPLQGRYQHGATYTQVTVNTGQFIESEWLVIAGGTYTSTFSDAYVFAITMRVWLRIVPPVTTSIQSIIPCVAFVGTRLVFTIFASGSTSNTSQTSTSAHLVVWNILDFNWGTVTITDWDANPGRCSRVATYEQAQHSPLNPRYVLGASSLVAGSGLSPTPSGAAAMASSVTSTTNTANRAPFAIQEFTVEDCEALWTSNYYTSSSGLECLRCPSNTYADDPLRISCTTCPKVADNIPHPWQLQYCYTNDSTSANTSFAMIVFLQIIAVPILVIFTTAITRSTAWEEDEYVVTELCESIADMMLERVAFLEHVSNPTKLQVALAQCVRNIKVYRRLIPIAVLHYADYVAWKARAKVAAQVHYHQQQAAAAAAATAAGSARRGMHPTTPSSAKARQQHISSSQQSPTSQALQQRHQQHQLLSPSSNINSAVSPADLSFNMEMSAFNHTGQRSHHAGGGGPVGVALLSPTIFSASSPRLQQQQPAQEGGGSRPSSRGQQRGAHMNSYRVVTTTGGHSLDSSTTTFGTSTSGTTTTVFGDGADGVRGGRGRRGTDAYGTHATSSEDSDSMSSTSTSSFSSGASQEMSEYSNAGGDGDGGRSRQHSTAAGATVPPTRQSTARSKLYEAHRPAPLTRLSSMRSGITAARPSSDDRRSASGHNLSDALTADAADRRARGEGGAGRAHLVVPELRLSVSQAVIYALQPRYKARRVTMLWMRLDGFDAWRETFTYSRNGSQTEPHENAKPPSTLAADAQGQTTTTTTGLQRQTTNDSLTTSVSPMGGMAAFQKKYTALIDNTIDIIHAYQGVPEAFMGDSILASWNALKPCGEGASQALNVAYYVNSNPTLRSIAQLRATVSVVHGKAKVGVIGMDQSKRPVIMSHIIEECIQLGAHCRSLEVGSLVEWTPEVQLSLADHFVFRIVGVGNFYRKHDSRRRRHRGPQHIFTVTPPTDLTAAAGQHRESTATPATDAGLSAAGGGGGATMPRPHVALVAELLGPTSLTQWQYELKGHREFVDAYNTVVRTVFEGRLNDARAIPLPRAMPKWLQNELAHITQTGNLKTVEVWS